MLQQAEPSCAMPRPGHGGSPADTVRQDDGDTLYAHMNGDSGASTAASSQTAPTGTSCPFGARKLKSYYKRCRAIDRIADTLVDIHIELNSVKVAMFGFIQRQDREKNKYKE